jgi:hypothetical protein
MVAKLPVYVPPKSNTPISMRSLYWAAGFLEGEGCFAACSGNVPSVQASQKHLPSLEKLKGLFGGNIHLQKRASNGIGGPVYRWMLYKGAPGVMMTLYSLMSPYRQTQIAKALAVWRTRGQHNQRGPA